ncbi:MAG: PAS domain S-box protein [Chthoniobacterales bacterium]
MSSTPTEAALDPAATDETGENSRDGAAKRRDPNEPSAVVGLGASAGGIAVLQQFFADMPADSGLAFVVVMHLSPEHESSLAHIIQTKTSMPTLQVTERIKVRPNHVYVIPPNKQLTFADSFLELLEPQQALGKRVTIDLFFRTLSQSYGQRAIGVILSGTDSDGVIGLKHIRAQGGVTVAQDPSEAEHASMPATAIATGMIDWVLPIAKLAPRLMEFVKNENLMRLPPEIPEETKPDAKAHDAPGGETVSNETRDEHDERALRDVLAILRRQTGNDFSHYKRATLLRRIARRLQVNSMESIPEYLEFLRQHPPEAIELHRDLLIGVTHFFRDRAAFAALEANIPQLFAGKTKNEQLRVWVAGCATGEEAYSIAMLLCEHAERLDAPPTIQIFATDIDEQSISDARQAIYPTTIEADVSPERLRVFFGKDHGRYRVRKSLREKVLFAAHNLLNDPPFSKLDLVSCRNLLIYLNPKAQDQVFDIFHFTLRAGALLFIGGSETTIAANALFSAVDAKHRLYARRSVPRPSWKIPIMPGPLPKATLRGTARPRPLLALSANIADAASTDTRESVHAGQERRSKLFGELHLKLLEQYAPPSVVVNEAHDIVHLSENAGRYLHFAAGEPTANLMKVVDPALQVELRTALFRAARGEEPIETAPLTVRMNGKSEQITVTVRSIRAQDLEQGFYLVTFAKQTDERLAPPAAAAAPGDSLAHDLHAEIETLKRQLNDASEQYEAANEEQKASNEELQAMNEELRSATEELETSKEELQSLNEELVTVNNELKNSVEDLSRSNADLTNLMASTDIGTLFLDRQLRIQRFTPSAQKIFNLIPADVGRPISDLTSKLTHGGLEADAEKVLDDLVPIEREIPHAEGQWMLVRIAPYRTAEDRIAGVVATFIDITRRKEAEDDLRAAHERARRQVDQFNTIMAAVPDFVYQFDLEGRFTYISQSLLDLWRLTPDQAIGRNFHELDYTPELATQLQRQIREVIEARRPLKDETPYTSVVGERMYEYLFFPLLAHDGSVEGVGGVTRDITDRRRAEGALRESEARFRQFAENSSDVFWILDAQTARLEYVNPVYDEMYGQSRELILHDRKRWIDVVHPDDHEKAESSLPQALSGEAFVRNYRIIRPSDGETHWIRDTGFPIKNEKGEIIRVAGVAQDLTEDQKKTEALRVSEERFRLLVEGARDYAMFVIGLDNRISYWSGGAERIFGWTAEEAIGQSGELIFTPEDVAGGREEKEREIALHEGCATDCRWHMRKDGSRIWVDGVMRRLDDDQDNLRGWAKIARDLTAERAADERLRRSYEDLERRVSERTADLTTANEKLEAALVERAEIERELLRVSEREKRRIGQDLHDSLCQELAATAFFLESKAQSLSTGRAAEAKALSDAARIVNVNVGVARDLARGLYPVELATSGFSEALRDLAFRHSTEDAHCRFESPKSIRVKNETIALALYRIAQEALNNAIKNGRAREILIRLERRNRKLSLIVQDDGIGFSPDQTTKGMGIHIMKYRANSISGLLKVESSKGKGTTVTCTV